MKNKMNRQLKKGCSFMLIWGHYTVLTRVIDLRRFVNRQYFWSTEFGTWRRGK